MHKQPWHNTARACAHLLVVYQGRHTPAVRVHLDAGWLQGGPLAIPRLIVLVPDRASGVGRTGACGAVRRVEVCDWRAGGVEGSQVARPGPTGKPLHTALQGYHRATCTHNRPRSATAQGSYATAPRFDSTVGSPCSYACMDSVRRSRVAGSYCTTADKLERGGSRRGENTLQTPAGRTQAVYESTGQRHRQSRGGRDRDR